MTQTSSQHETGTSRIPSASFSWIKYNQANIDKKLRECPTWEGSTSSPRNPIRVQIRILKKREKITMRPQFESWSKIQFALTINAQATNLAPLGQILLRKWRLDNDSIKKRNHKCNRNVPSSLIRRIIMHQHPNPLPSKANPPLCIHCLNGLLMGHALKNVTLPTSRQHFLTLWSCPIWHSILSITFHGLRRGGLEESHISDD